MLLNKAWHQAHPMPARASTRQRAEWHLEHTRECRCRPIPPRLLEQMTVWGMLPDADAIKKPTDR